MTEEVDSPPRRTRAPRARNGSRGEFRATARDRLIESRLTPNAISLTGFVLNLVAAALILEEHFVLAAFAFIIGSVMDMFDGRYSRMSGKGTRRSARSSTPRSTASRRGSSWPPSRRTTPSRART